MNEPTVPVRVTAAKRLLEDGVADFESLPPGCQAYLQEAIEFLGQIEEELSGGGRKK